MQNDSKRPNGQVNRGFSTGQRASNIGNPQNPRPRTPGTSRPAQRNGDSRYASNQQRPQSTQKPQTTKRPSSTRGAQYYNRQEYKNKPSGRYVTPSRDKIYRDYEERNKRVSNKNVKNKKPTHHNKGNFDISSLISYLEPLKKYYIYILAVIALIVVISLFAAFKTENPLKLKPSESPVYISEYMSKNTHYYFDNMKTPDWVEIYNPTDNDIDLTGFSLSNGKKKIKLKSVIEKKGYLVIQLSDSAFTLDHDLDGETFYLKDNSKKLVDLVTTKKNQKNDSIVRTKNANGEIKEKVMKKSTPGFSNNKKGLEAYLSTKRADNEIGLKFNEVMASNKNTYEDEFGDTVDYIELKNTTEKAIDISNYGLTDDESDPFKYTFPKGTKLKKGGIVLVNLSKDYKLKDENGVKSIKESKVGAYLATFNLKKGKENAYISSPDAKIIEKIALDSLGSDQSLIRTEDGSYITTYYISPGFENNDEGVKAYSDTVKNETDINGLYISEAMSKNSAYYPYNEKYYDWIEIYNPTDKAINLNGYMLSDNKNKPEKYIIKDKTIQAKSYLVFLCSDKKLNTTNTGFSLNGGCACYLFAPDKTILDKITLSELVTNVSKGRTPGNAKFKYFEKPTPGQANTAAKDSLLSAPVASVKSGQYNNVDTLEVALSAGGTIYYTTDGSKPNKNSTKYTAPIKLKKTTVIRAIAISSKAAKSSVATYSYIINENHKMDVVMVSANADDLFSYSSGIYAKGPGASNTFPYFGANFWKDWSRQANISLIPYGDKEKGFSIDGETSIFGGYSRGYEKKSLKFKFKDVYGQSHLNYSVFENRDFSEYDSLVLRPCGQDVNGAVMRDDLITTMSDKLVDVMASRPVVLYINGQYYGIYYIREKINAKFVASHINVSEDSVDLLQTTGDINAGSREDWVSLMNYLSSHSLADNNNYKYVCDRVDVKNLADYVIAEMYCGNTDGGNIRWYKSKEGDNKWRWIMYDTDYGFTKRDYSFFNLINPNANITYEMFPRKLLNALFKNKQFRDLFVSRLEYQMNNVWNTDNVIKTIDGFASRIEDEIPRNHKRWGVTSDWNRIVEQMREFARSRQAEIKNEFATSTALRGIIALSDAELNRCFEH